MAKVEIEESELAALHRVSKFAETALANPETRRTFLEVQKKLNPQAVIPELDATDSVMKVVKDLKDELAADRAAREAERGKDDETRRTQELQSRISKGQDHLRTAGYNAEGIDKIEKLMLEEGISSYAAGLALFERLNPPPSPSDSTRSSRFGASFEDDFMTADDNKELWESQGQSESWLNKSLASVRQGFRN